MHSIRHFLNILMEANVSKENWKFWYNVNTGKLLWFGGTEHHAHAIYINSHLFGLTAEQLAALRAHPAMEDADEEDEGARIIYLPELFWSVMQQGWVRGGLEGDYDNYDSDIMHHYGLYLEGKNLRDIAKAAQAIAEEAAGDPDDDWGNDDSRWEVEKLRIAVRTGPARDAETVVTLSGKRAEYFIKTGRIPSRMM
jgi:hypothetical protein